MASVNWLKVTNQKLGAMKKHLGKTERAESNHANSDIDKTKSHLNIFIGADDYEPMLNKVRSRIAAVDREHPPLKIAKNRVVAVLLETPVPQVVAEQGRAEEFLSKAHKVIEDFFGAENVGGTCGHFDEQHLYKDAQSGDKRLSLIHGHTVVAAYAKWSERTKTGETRERVGINGKHCETKARLAALNKAMDEMCRREYGISYNTGETPQRKSVERLKLETKLKDKEFELKEQIENLVDERSAWLRLRPAPQPPQGDRPEPWETYLSHHTPCGKGGKPYKAGTRRYLKAVEQLQEQYNALNAPWLQYDQLLAAWGEDLKEFRAVETAAKNYEKLCEEYTKVCNALRANENALRERVSNFDDKLLAEAGRLSKSVVEHSEGIAKKARESEKEALEQSTAYKQLAEDCISFLVELNERYQLPGEDYQYLLALASDFIKFENLEKQKNKSIEK